MKGFESCRTSVMMTMRIGESWSEKHQLWLINMAACGGRRWFLRSGKRTESPLFFLRRGFSGTVQLREWEWNVDKRK